MTNKDATAPAMTLPDWASELVTLYEANAVNQFILHGNVNDRMLLPLGEGKPPVLGNLQQFLLDVLMPRFDVVLTYDLGNGVRIERGGQLFAKWPGYKEAEPLPKGPRHAVEFLTHYFRYGANLMVRLKPYLIAAAVLALSPRRGGRGEAWNVLRAIAHAGRMRRIPPRGVRTGPPAR